MKSMFSAFLAIGLVAVLASFGLGNAGFSAQEVTSSPSVRLD
ncbi:MAG: F0F1-type ATP synthase membrane subunit c/vacuolar-type H+-ATPase subunit K [Pseudorhodobacter sp.]|jgi:F0F1-type ATP synthase membrane subunit c/vacuolar-type H+-ATPase subunit K